MGEASRPFCRKVVCPERDTVMDGVRLCRFKRDVCFSLVRNGVRYADKCWNLLGLTLHLSRLTDCFYARSIATCVYMQTDVLYIGTHKRR